jgi:ATP-binding cassette subfamily C protein
VTIQNHSFPLLYSFVDTLFKYAGVKAIQAGGLLFLSGLFQGFSLLMLLPLLGLTGLAGQSEATDSISKLVKGFLDALEISYSLPSVLGIFLIIMVTEAIFLRYRIIVLNDLKLKFTNHLRNLLYRQISAASWQFHSCNHSSDSMHMLDNAVRTIGDGTYYVLQLFVVISQAIVFLFVASTLSMSMTFVMLISGFVLYALVLPVNRKVFRHGEKAVKTNQTLYRNMVDFFGGLKLAKSYNRSDEHINEFEHTGKRLLIDEKAVVSASASAQMWLRILSVGLLCIFVYVALTIAHIGAERVLVLIIVVNRLYSVFSSGQNCWQALLQSLPSYDIYNQAMQRFQQHQEPIQNHDTPIPVLKSHLRLENISFQYQKNTQAPTLSDITVTFPAYKTTAIVGESGAGKSTLADILMGLLIPDSGKIFLDTKELTPELLYNWRQHIAYVPQDVYLFDGTIRSNLQWISDQVIDDEQLWQTLGIAAAADFIRRLPEQLDTRVGERGVKLSGGERQRIALARALLKKPDLLILDEATSALDQQNEQRILDVLTRLHGSITIIIIAHRESTIQHADFVVLIEEGCVKASGTWNLVKRIIEKTSIELKLSDN